MLLPLLAQTVFVFPLPDAQGPARSDLRQTGCAAPEVTHRFEHETDQDNDGTVDFAFHRTLRHDARGNEVLSIYSSGSLTERVEQTFDAEDRLLLRVFKADNDNDGTFDYVEIRETTYDSAGRLATQRTEDLPANGPGSINNVLYVYDPDGNLVHVTVQYDVGIDGSIDSIYAVDQTFDVAGNLLTSVQLADNDADGVVDWVARTTLTYDSNGLLLVTEQRNDGNNDGVDEAISTDTLAYDGQGQVILRVLLSDNDGDGAFDSRQEYTHAYDPSGNRILTTGMGDNDNDGVAEWTETDTITYDALGNQTSRITLNDEDANGQDDFSFTEHWTYDSRGRILTETEEDSNLETGFGTTVVLNNTWSDAGTLLELRVETDYGRDGVVDSVSVSRQLVEDLRVNSTRWLQEKVADMALGGLETTIGDLLEGAVGALEEGHVSRALRFLIAYDAFLASVEGAGLITEEEGAELREPVPGMIDLYVETCFALER